MPAHTNHPFIPFLCTVSLTLLAVTGCHSQEADRNVASYASESPTTRGTRALLLVPADEFKILQIDGKQAHRSRSDEIHGLRAYRVSAGEHTVTASFRYAAPVSGRLLGEVRGRPMKLNRVFRANHEYVALYRMHRYPKPEARWWLEEVLVAVFMPKDVYWSMEILDLGDVSTEMAAASRREPMPVGQDLRRRLSDCHAELAERLAAYLRDCPDLAPETRQALLYRSFPEEMSATLEHAKSELCYNPRFAAR